MINKVVVVIFFGTVATIVSEVYGLIFYASVLLFCSLKRHRFYFIIFLFVSIFSYTSIMRSKSFVQSHSHRVSKYYTGALLIKEVFTNETGSIAMAELSDGCIVKLYYSDDMFILEPLNAYDASDLRLRGVFAGNNSNFAGYGRYMLSKGVCYTAWLYRFNTFSKLPFYQKNEFDFKAVVKKYIRISFHKYLNPDSASFVCALVIGDKSDLEKDEYNRFKELSISHLIVVSGYQIVVIYFILNLILIPVTQSYRFRSLLNLLFIFFYTWLCDFDAPVLRACLMISVYVLRNLYYCNLSRLMVLLLSFSIINIINPLESYNIGMYMSFLAAAGIMYVYPILKSSVDMSVSNKIVRNLIYPFLVTFSALIMLTPVVLNSFGKIYLFSLTLNYFIGLHVSLILILSVVLVICPIDVIISLLSSVLNLLYDSVSGTVLFFDEHLRFGFLSAQDASVIVMSSIAYYVVIIALLILYNVYRNPKVISLGMLITAVSYCI